MNRSALLFLLAGAAVLATLYLWLRPDTAVMPMAAAPTVSAAERIEVTAAAPAALEDAASGIQQFEWVIRDGQRVSGPERISVSQDTPLSLRVTSDHNDELHLHGYDLQIKLVAGEAATLVLDADHAGRFDLELHHGHQTLTTLEVHPR